MYAARILIYEPDPFSINLIDFSDQLDCENVVSFQECWQIKTATFGFCRRYSRRIHIFCEWQTLLRWVELASHRVKDSEREREKAIVQVKAATATAIWSMYSHDPRKCWFVANIIYSFVNSSLYVVRWNRSFLQIARAHLFRHFNDLTHS